MLHSQLLPSLNLMLIAGRAAALVMGFIVLAWAFSQWRRTAQRDTQRVFEQLDLVRAELLIMKEVMHDAATRVDRVAERVGSEARLTSTGGGAIRGYEIAARMARNGASKEELIRSCGVTHHEAELLIKLHSRDSHNSRDSHRDQIQGDQIQDTAGRDKNRDSASNVKTAAELIGRQPKSANGVAGNTTPKTPSLTKRLATSRLMAVG